MATYTNVEGVLWGAIPLPGAKSITIEKTIARLDSQADGARGKTMVGELATSFTFSVELESNGEVPELATVFGLTLKDTLTFEEQLDSAAGTTKTHTVTNLVALKCGLSTAQDNPNGVTVSGESYSTNSVWSIT